MSREGLKVLWIWLGIAVLVGSYVLLVWLMG